MKKVLFAFATLLMVACGNKIQRPEVEEEYDSINLPEYKLVDLEDPFDPSDGHTYPGKIVYNIEIDHPIQKDSLKLIQDFFIKKGKKDFSRINKVTVHAYLKGTTIYRLPYASLIYIDGYKEILINEEAKDIEVLAKENPSNEKNQAVADPIVGIYFCNRTHDTYEFKSDKTGLFTIQGGNPSPFTWKRSGNNITIKYKDFGEQKLKFDQKSKTLTEKSESFGTLVFNKK